MSIVSPGESLRPIAARRRWQAGALIAAMMVALGSGAAYWRWKYPCGRQHQPAAALYAALIRYAEAHDGRFPSGELTPEGSLGLLWQQGFLREAEVLRGKCGDLAAVRQQLERGELLDPATCGWHYQEGLTTRDDGRLALAWDKFGLGADAGRVFRGGCEVLFVDGSRQVIRDYRWAEFARSQRELWQALEEQRLEGASEGGRQEPLPEEPLEPAKISSN